VQIVEFFYDFSCPYAYLAATQIEGLCARYGARFEPKPMLLGGVFRALRMPQSLSEVHSTMADNAIHLLKAVLGGPQNGGGTPSSAVTMSPAKAKHNLEDMHRWAEYWGVPLRMPHNHPQRTVTALRVVLAAPQEARWALSQAIYRAYWVNEQEISDPAVLLGCCEAVGLDGQALLLRAESEEVKRALYESTDEAVRRGVFGAPTMFLNGETMLWGQDRLSVLESLLSGASAGPLPEAAAVGEVSAQGAGEAQGEGAKVGDEPRAEVRFIFDLSSPFSYLAATKVEALCARIGAKLVWHPVLLGGLFKLVGMSDVPLLAMSAPKQAYQTEDLLRSAAMSGVAFTFNSRFPLRTVTAQRMIVAALADEAKATEAAALIGRLYRAAWAHDLDIADEAVLRQCCAEVGLDGDALLEAAQSAQVKQRLFDLTQQAVDLGAFGAPTCVINGQDLLWGQDRLTLVEWLISRHPSGA
jgi:2-hydroxychromene-2-carboxylate isomerase